MALHPIVESIMQGWQLGQNSKHHRDDLAERMAARKSSEGIKKRELSQHDDGEQGVDLDTQRAGALSSQAADEADQALGDGTADAAGIGSSGISGTADSQMSNFIGRMSRKQEAGVKDTEAQARQREETANWMARRRDKAPGGGSQAPMVAAQKALLVPLQKKVAMGEELTPEEQATLLPRWAYADHGPLDYVTRADHRAWSGKIISRGAACQATRQHNLLRLTFADGDTVVLDGSRHCLVGAPADERAAVLLIAS